MAAVPSRSAHSLTDAQRKELLNRLIQERQSRPGLESAVSSESLAEKRERVQQLLRERRSSQGCQYLHVAVAPPLQRRQELLFCDRSSMNIIYCTH